MQAKPKATSQEEMEKLKETIESLVKEMMRLGFKKTDAMQLISNTWNLVINQQLRENLLQMTEQEEEFCKKVDRFVQEYGDYFVGRVLLEDYRRLKPYPYTKTILNIAKNWDEHDFIIEGFTIYLKTVYVVFIRELSITQEKLRLYSQRMWGTRSDIAYLYTKTLEDFLYDFIFVNGEKPICDPFNEKRNDYDEYQSFHSKGVKEFNEFAENYKFRSVPLNRASLKLIWLIETYF